MNTLVQTMTLLGCALMAAATVQAGTLEEDEARVAELMRAELAATPLPPSGTTVTLALSAPAPVIAEVIAPAAAPAAPADEDWLARTARHDGVPFSELTRFLGRRVTIVTTGERVHRGTVSAANAREVTLQVRRAGGGASYTLLRGQIARIELR